MINYNNKIFRSVSHSENGETVAGSIFEYRQTGNILTCTYESKNVSYGHLLAIVDDHGNLNMRYHQLNRKGELMTGHCISTPEMLENGKVRLYEKWKWTSGDLSEGESMLEEA